MLAEHVVAFPSHDCFVFSGPGRGPLRLNNFRKRVFDPAVKAAGLHHPVPHELKHTAVSLAIKAGAHPKVIQELAGHSNIQTTLNVYGHLFPSLAESLSHGLEQTLRDAVTYPTPEPEQAEVVGTP
jgi:integrase